MAFTSLIDVRNGNTTPTPLVHQLLTNGSILILYDDAAAYILTPSSLGDYQNCTIRRIADSPYTHLYGSVTVSNSGLVFFWPGEYGTSAAVNGVSIFDPVTETWASIAGSYVGGHMAANLSDDGRHFGPGGIMDANNTNVNTPVALTSVPFHAWHWSETCLASLPDGRFMVIGGFFPGDPANPDKKIEYVRPNYSAGYVTGGSFSGGTNDVQQIDLTTALNAIGADWRYNDITFAGMGYIDYERGPSAYMPKIGKVAHISGMGRIFTIDPTNNNVANPANLGVEQPPGIGSSFLNIGETWGVLGSQGWGNNVNRGFILSNGSSTLVVNTTDTPSVANAKVTNAMTVGNISTVKRVYVWTDSRTKVVSFIYTTVTYNSTTSQYTFSGLSADNYNNNTTSLLATGQEVAMGNPVLSSRDAPGVILPNGDFVFLAGAEYKDDAVQFNQRCRFYKWDGTSSTPSQLALDATGNLSIPEYLCMTSMLPDGSIFVTISISVGQSKNVFRYVPSTAELTPMSGSQPNITSAPEIVQQGKVFHLYGTQLNGLHEGGFFGDDKTPRSNFPIARFVNTTTGNVYYGRTSGYTYRGIQSNRVSITQVTTPASIPDGKYSLEIVASGVASLPKTIMIGPTPYGGDSVFIDSYK